MEEEQDKNSFATALHAFGSHHVYQHSNGQSKPYGQAQSIPSIEVVVGRGKRFLSNGTLYSLSNVKPTLHL